jgi:iron complex outermembrane receptor protein
VVAAVRAAEWVPVTTEDLGREAVSGLEHGQEMPFLLKQAPSLTQYSDGGAEGGYSYLYLRGIPQTRLNLTLDGVPLSDGEDGAFYWVDLPGLAGSVDNVQIQRGVGTSSFGAAAFGGAVHLESTPAEGGKPALDGALGGGSLGTMRGSLGAHSGSLGGGFAAFARATYQETDGYRDHSGVLQRSLALEVSRQTSRSVFKLFGLAGREQQQLAFYAADEDTLRVSPRANPLSPEERDRFGQGLVQAQYSHAFSPATHATAQAYTNAADGWYRIYSDPEHSSLYEYGLDWRSIGGRLSVAQQRGRTSLILGAFVQDFASTHTRDVVDGDRDYLNQGHKDEMSAFAKAGFEAGRWHAYADAQVRHARFRYEGDLDLGSVSWTFFNPRLGTRFALSPAWSLYASIGRTTREPARSDLFAGEDNPTLAYDLSAVRPERVTDIEAGVDRRTERFSLQANLYLMEFRNEIAQTGELSEIGLPLRRNVDRSHRRGLEVEAGFLPSPSWRLAASTSLNRSRIRSWTQYLDVYDASGEYVGSEPRTFADVPPLLTPAFLANLSVERRQGPLQVTLSGRYVGTAFLDNTGNEGSRTPGFFDADATARLSLKGLVDRGRPSLRIGVSNLFDHRRRWPSGYSYPFLERDAQGRDTTGAIDYFYPLAGRTFFVGLELSR